MKIEIEVENIELFAKALNNAYLAYHYIVSSIELGCEIPSKFYSLSYLPEEELHKRRNCLRDVYMQIEKIESMMGD